MSKEQDSATNKSLRVGISGKNAKNALPDLKVFTVRKITDGETVAANSNLFWRLFIERYYGKPVAS